MKDLKGFFLGKGFGAGLEDFRCTSHTLCVLFIYWVS